MPNTPRMKWPIPGEHVDPWFEAFVDLMGEVDASGYAAREDRNIIGTGGGTFTLTGGLITWAGTISFLAANTGFLWQIAPGNITLADGQIWYVNLVRAPADNITLANVVASNLSAAADGDAAFVIAVRRGSKVYFRNGRVLDDGDSFEVFEGNGGGGGAGTLTVFTFRPGGGLTGPSVFDNFASLYVAFQASQLASQGSELFTVIMDDSVAAVVVPSGAYAMPHTVLRNRFGPGINQTPVELANGAVISGLQGIVGLQIDNPSAATPGITVDDGECLILEGTAILATGNAIIDVIGSAPLPTIDLGVASLLDPASVTVTGSILIRVVGAGAQMSPGALVGAGSKQVQVLDDTSFVYSNTGTVDQSTMVRLWPTANGTPQTANCNANYNEVLLIDGSGGPFTVTLPLVAFFRRGQPVIIKEVGGSFSGVVTIDGNGALIDGQATLTFNVVGETLFLVSDDANNAWHIISRKRFDSVFAGGDRIRVPIAMALDAETDQSTYQVVGNFSLNPADYDISGMTQEIRFLAVGLITNSVTSGDIQLFNLTDSAVVATHTFTGAPETSPTKKLSSALVLPVSEKMYEVRIRVTGGTPPTDKVFAMWAGFQIDNIVA